MPLGAYVSVKRRIETAGVAKNAARMGHPK
jgi:hypothetical protein